MSRKILIVAESIDVEDSSGTKGRVALINNLLLAGYELTVFHYTRRDIELDGIKTISIKERRFSLLFFLSRLERQIRYRLNLKLNKYIERYLGFSFTLFNDRNSIANRLKKVPVSEYDLIITLSKGGSFRPHHALLKLPEWHMKWLAYIHDPYPMHHYPKPYTWQEPGFKKKEEFIKEISIKARWSGFPSLLLKEWMGQFYPLFLTKGLVIPHQIYERDTSEVNIPNYFDSKNFNLLHAGNLLGARNPNGLIKAFQIFISENPKAKAHSRLLFIGAKDPNLKIHAKGDNLFFSEGYMEFETVRQLQNLASVNIIIEAKSEFSPFLPGKFPHCVDANKPILILGPEKSEVRRLLGKAYPFWSEIDDVQRIKENIEKLYDQWTRNNYRAPLVLKDLKRYMGPVYLKEVIESLN